MITAESFLLVLVLLAGLYMAWNIGANDVANAMGTSVGSGALTLFGAVIVAAVLEFSGAFFFGSHVTETIQKGIIDPDIFSTNPLLLAYGMLAALIAAGVWLQVASYFGWPVSTTHSIIGAVVGFGTIIGGVNAIYWKHVSYIISSWVLSPILGGFFSYVIFSILRYRIFYQQNPVKAAKQLTPFIVFAVVSTLVVILSTNINFNVSPAVILSFGIIVGGLSSLFSYITLRNITVHHTYAKAQSTYNPEMAIELSKAKKHLRRVQSVSTGEVYTQLSRIINRIRGLPYILETPESDEVSEAYDTVEKIFGYLQIMSACMMAFAHGANDVANAIGPLAACVSILTTGVISQETAIPLWILSLGGIGIVIGLATWGWRVIETVGKKITELTPTRGFSAEFGAALTILIASRFGLPISTTHTLVGSVVGIGLARGIEALDLSTIRNIVISWLVTVPAGAILATFFFYIIKIIFD